MTRRGVEIGVERERSELCRADAVPFVPVLAPPLLGTLYVLNESGRCKLPGVRG